MKPDGTPSLYGRRLYRVVSVVLGLLIVGTGLYALLFAPESDLLRALVALALVVVGGNMVHAGWRARASWLSRLGPLP
ncbi:hypothetical protein [Hydrogenophaga sp.]|uniref:hypothetical protein n=1 Tax=Hydrogenophaga sp. TaxID=1904254 RepID=UPI00260CAC43|nr:hypothetical protein [Hydrogenophaga sp.]MCW5655797.1 hypothetical protein [Hydrogenophaga sp.]